MSPKTLCTIEFVIDSLERLEEVSDCYEDFEEDVRHYLNKLSGKLPPDVGFVEYKGIKIKIGSGEKVWSIEDLKSHTK